MGFGRYKAFGRRGFGHPDPPLQIMAKRSGSLAAKGGGLFGLDVRIDQDEFSVAVGALSLCDAVSRALLALHADSIEDGQRASGGAQAPLDPQARQGKRAAHGERPSARGNTGTAKAIPPNLTRSEIKGGTKVVSIGQAVNFSSGANAPRPKAAVMGVKADASIYPMFAGQAKFIAQEAERGIEYLFVDGRADRVIEDVVIDYLTTVFDGTRYYDPSKTTAKELRSGL